MFGHLVLEIIYYYYYVVQIHTFDHTHAHNRKKVHTFFLVVTSGGVLEPHGESTPLWT